MFQEAQPHGLVKQQQLTLSLLEFIITNNLSLNIVYSKGFRKFCHALDPSFVMPSNKALEILITNEYKNGIESLIALMETSCKLISLTINTWTAESKAGYIGITAHWINQKFKSIDALLNIEYLPYPHTGDAISEFIENTMRKFNLLDKLGFIVTDNGSNMKHAVTLLNEKFNLQRLSCTAHTLQFSINIGLSSSKKQIDKFKKLVDFFSSPKQSDRFINAQKELNRKFKRSVNSTILESDQEENDDDDNDNDIPFSKITKPIAEVKMHWNSKYHS